MSRVGNRSDVHAQRTASVARNFRRRTAEIAAGSLAPDATRSQLRLGLHIHLQHRHRGPSAIWDVCYGKHWNKRTQLVANHRSNCMSSMLIYSASSPGNNKQGVQHANVNEIRRLLRQVLTHLLRKSPHYWETRLETSVDFLAT